MGPFDSAESLQLNSAVINSSSKRRGIVVSYISILVFSCHSERSEESSLSSFFLLNSPSVLFVLTQKEPKRSRLQKNRLKITAPG